MRKAIVSGCEIATYNQPLSAGQRGLIVSNQISRKVFDGDPVKPEILRMLTLFFDVIDIPRGPEDWILRSDFGRRGKGRNADEQFLIESNFITRSVRIPKQEGHAINIDRGEYFGSDVLQARESAEPGRWALSTVSGQRPVLRPDAGILGRGIALELYDALPIPERDTPLEDCLTFRTKYNDELLALRHHIDSVSEKIRSSSDFNLSHMSEIEHLSRSAKDYIRAMKGYGIQYTINNFGFDFTLVGTSLSLALAYPEHSSLFFGATAAAKILNVAFHRPSPDPFAYLWSVHKNL